MVRKSFESFIGTVDSFVREESARQSHSLVYSHMARDSNYEAFRSMPIIDTSILSSVRDIDDNVFYFMIGIDRIDRPAKVGA